LSGLEDRLCLLISFSSWLRTTQVFNASRKPAGGGWSGLMHGCTGCMEVPLAVSTSPWDWLGLVKRTRGHSPEPPVSFQHDEFPSTKRPPEDNTVREYGVRVRPPQPQGSKGSERNIWSDACGFGSIEILLYQGESIKDNSGQTVGNIRSFSHASLPRHLRTFPH
jgi:hypothetical protein